MAYTPANYTGDGSTTDFAFSFPYIDYEDVKVLLDDVETFAFTIVSESTVRFTAAPANGVDIKIYRDTPIEVAEATFYSGSAIRAVDLNENFNQSRYYGEETRELVADATIGTIPDGSIGTAKLVDGAITAAKLADNSVTAAKLADDSVDAAAIQDSAVTAVTIATGAVTNTKIADNAVTNAKLADSAVNTAELASSAVSTAKIADDAVTTAKLDSTGIAPTVTAINGGPLAGFRNAIINGNFDIWQRGTSFTGNEYGADRWLSSRAGSTCTMSRQPFTLGQTDVPGEPTYFCRMAVTSVAGAANDSILRQRIEGVKMFAGQQVTVSFWAKADATKSIAIELTQFFGTGGSPSATVDGIGAVKKTLTTAWQKITHTVTLPSVGGKTLGSDGNNRLSLNIWFDAGSDWDARTDTLGQQSGTFDIAQVQIEAGPVATPFERRPIGVELGLCYRYYWKPNFSSGHGQLGFGFTPSTTTVRVLVPTPVTMRAAPTITGNFIAKPDNTTITTTGVVALPQGIEIAGTKAVGTGGNAACTVAILPNDSPDFSAEL